MAVIGAAVKSRWGDVGSARRGSGPKPRRVVAAGGLCLKHRTWQDWTRPLRGPPSVGQPAPRSGRGGRTSSRGLSLSVGSTWSAARQRGDRVRTRGRKAVSKTVSANLGQEAGCKLRASNGPELSMSRTVDFATPRRARSHAPGEPGRRGGPETTRRGGLRSALPVEDRPAVCTSSARGASAASAVRWGGAAAARVRRAAASKGRQVARRASRRPPRIQIHTGVIGNYSALTSACGGDSCEVTGRRSRRADVKGAGTTRVSGHQQTSSPKAPREIRWGRSFVSGVGVRR